MARNVGVVSNFGMISGSFGCACNSVESLGPCSSQVKGKPSLKKRLRGCFNPNEGLKGSVLNT